MPIPPLICRLFGYEYLLEKPSGLLESHFEIQPLEIRFLFLTLLVIDVDLLLLSVKLLLESVIENWLDGTSKVAIFSVSPFVK